MMTLNRTFWQGRRVCVTGGTGFLGWHLVRQLLALDCRVRVLGLKPSESNPIHSLSETSLFFGDVRDGSLVKRAVDGCSVVFHTAGNVAMWGPGLAKMYDIHVGGTNCVLNAVSADCRVVHTSSVVAVGASRGKEVLTEDSPFNLSDLKVDYVHAKRNAEEAALERANRGADVVVVNPGYMIGPEDHEDSVMGSLCKRFWKRRVPVIPSGGLNLVDVRDVATGHFLAAERGQSGRRYILGGQNQTMREWMGVLREIAPGSRFSVPVPYWLLSCMAHIAELRARYVQREPYPALQHVLMNRFHWFYSCDRAAKELGYQPRSLHESVRDTHAWFFGPRKCTKIRSFADAAA